MTAPAGTGTPDSSPTILSVDTSLPVLSVALTRGQMLAGAVALLGKESRNEKLLPSMDWLLSEAGIERRAVDLLVVTRGPGSFTGVRVGLATIQGLSFALGIPTFAMSTHEAIAEAARDTSSVLIHGTAGRGELYVSAFVDEIETMEPRLMTREAFDELRGSYESVLDVDEQIERVNVALLAARRSARLFGEGIADRYTAVTPIYVRLAEAEVRLQQRAHEQSSRPG